MQIKIKDLSYTYQAKTPFAAAALNDINLDLDGNFFLALVGQTGSGKSTLVQHLNALLLPTSGSIQIDNFLVKPFKRKKWAFIDLNLKNCKKRKQFDLKLLRKKAGLVFQFPEYQLFESTVLKDVMFGPLNYKIEPKKAEDMAKKALTDVGIDSSYYSRSPFELSGGEKRRVAIAGILALNPDVLILDEPTAGLDPLGEQLIMNLFNKIHLGGKPIILVTHNMDIVLKYAEKVVVLDHSKLIISATPLELFQNEEVLKKTAIDLPQTFLTAIKLKEAGFNIDLKKVKDVKSLALQIKENYNG